MAVESKRQARINAQVSERHQRVKDVSRKACDCVLVEPPGKKCQQSTRAAAGSSGERVSKRRWRGKAKGGCVAARCARDLQVSERRKIAEYSCRETRDRIGLQCPGKPIAQFRQSIRSAREDTRCKHLNSATCAHRDGVPRRPPVAKERNQRSTAGWRHWRRHGRGAVAIG